MGQDTDFVAGFTNRRSLIADVNSMDGRQIDLRNEPYHSLIKTEKLEDTLFSLGEKWKNIPFILIERDENILNFHINQSGSIIILRQTGDVEIFSGSGQRTLYEGDRVFGVSGKHDTDAVFRAISSDDISTTILKNLLSLSENGGVSFSFLVEQKEQRNPWE